MKNSIRNRARPRRDCGQVMVLFVLLMVVLILFLGLGIDLGFSYITRANLSKAVDAAALMGAMNLSNGTNTAQSVALGAFDLNYGVSHRDAAPPDVTVQVFNDANNNLTVDVSASVNINTYFIRVLPQWTTLAVADSAEAVRNNVIMTLVLDTSGSMDPSRGPPPGGDGSGSGGGQFLPGAVTAFINDFNDNHDQAAVVRFSTIQSNVFFGGTLTKPQPTQPFKSQVINAVNGFISNWNGYTFSQGGLTNALVIENNATIPSGQSVVKIVVFCTDGRANTIQDNFNCPPVALYNYGGMDVCPGGQIHLLDPDTGGKLDTVDADCGTFPKVCTGVTEFFSAKTGSMENFCCDKVNAEAQFRAIQVANQMRGEGIIVYSIGVGSGFTPDLDFLSFLQQVANDPNAPDYVATSHDGEAVVANDPSQLKTVFQQIASKILLRLAK